MNFVGAVSHRFPNPINYFEQFKLWVLLINSALSNISPTEVYDKRRVCSIHFTDDCINPGQRNLKHNALPTLHMPPGIKYLLTSCGVY